MKRSKSIAQHLQAAIDFRDGFEHLFEMIRARDEWEMNSRSAFHSQGPEPYSEADIEAQRAEVARLSGPAAMAAAEARVLVTMQDPAVIGGRIKTINPLQGWFQALEGGPLGLSRGDVLDAANQTIGVLEARRRSAEQTERSLAGRVARFIGFADQVREIRGVQGQSKAGQVTFFVTVAAQVLATVIAVALLALLVIAGAEFLSQAP